MTLHNYGTSKMQYVFNNDRIWCGLLQQLKAASQGVHHLGARNGYPAPDFYSPMRYYFSKNSKLCFVQHFLLDGTGLALQINND